MKTYLSTIKTKYLFKELMVLYWDYYELCKPSKPASLAKFAYWSRKKLESYK